MDVTQNMEDVEAMVRATGTRFADQHPEIVQRVESKGVKFPICFVFPARTSVEGFEQYLTSHRMIAYTYSPIIGSWIMGIQGDGIENWLFSIHVELWPASSSIDFGLFRTYHQLYATPRNRTFGKHVCGGAFIGLTLFVFIFCVVYISVTYSSQP